MGRGITIVLAISLGLNFFLAGFLAKSWLSPEHRPPPPPMADGFKGFDHPGGLWRMAESLAPDQRDAMRKAFKEQLPDMRDHFKQMRTLRNDMRRLVESEEWDGAAVAAKMAEIRALRTQQQEAFDAAFLAAVGELPGDDRKRLIELSEERRGERRRPPHDKRKPE